ncbi:hypothetical protein ACGFX4_05110 [Kitasatospora sp. NPDC048365]|uniref:hypothetical protein n=1 Tax=Kitasatospora sp. NPDC048365 TaxID=3364050 RepID=UPI00371C52FF
MDQPARSAAPGRGTAPVPAWSRALLAAPVLLALYGGIRLLPGSRGPGAGWTTGHLALFAAMALLGAGFTGLYRSLAPRTRPGRLAVGASFGVTLLGLAASLGQVGIDLYVGATVADKAGQHAAFDRIQSHAGVVPAFYSVGPVLFYVGLLALVCAAAVLRRAPWWSALLVLAGTAVTAATLDLIPLGAVLYLAAFVPLARTGRRGAVSASGTPARAA